MLTHKNKHHGHNHNNHHEHHNHHHNSVKDAFGNLLDGMLDEISYQAEKKRLTQNIERLKSEALAQDVQQNYSAAVALYDAALREATALNHIWIRHQWHLGFRNNYATCSYHTQYINQINTLRITPYNKLQLEVQETQRLRKFEEDKIREARRLREVEEARQREAQALQDWQNKRQTIHHAELLQRVAFIGLEQAASVIKELHAMHHSYNTTRKYHDEQDREILRKLEAQKNRLDGLLFQESERKRLIQEAAEDNQRQGAIHHAMYHVLSAIDVGNISAARESLANVAVSANSFHNIENIQDQLRTPASVFKSSLQELTDLQREFNQNASVVAAEFAKHIILLVQQDTSSPVPGKALLYSSYEQELEDIIKKHFKSNWKKFNARDRPEDLVKAIAMQIVQRLKPIGNKRWMADVLTFTRWPNVSVNGYSALLLEVADLIDNYVSLNPPQLKKPNLDLLLRPYMEARNNTAAMAEQKDPKNDNVPMASYVYGDQQSEQKGSLEYNPA